MASIPIEVYVRFCQTFYKNNIFLKSYDNCRSKFAKLQYQMPLFTNGTLDCYFWENLWMNPVVSYHTFVLNVFIYLLSLSFVLTFSFVSNNYLAGLARLVRCCCYVATSPLIYYAGWWTCSYKMAGLDWNRLIKFYFGSEIN